MTVFHCYTISLRALKLCFYFVTFHFIALFPTHMNKYHYKNRGRLTPEGRIALQLLRQAHHDVHVPRSEGLHHEGELVPRQDLIILYTPPLLVSQLSRRQETHGAVRCHAARQRHALVDNNPDAPPSPRNSFLNVMSRSAQHSHSSPPIL